MTVPPSLGSSSDPEKLVPVLAIHVNRSFQGGDDPGEYTRVELENYFVTADDARAGRAARKISFQEAVQMMIF